MFTINKADANILHATMVIVNDMPVADLMTDDFGTLSMYTDKFWHKIVVEVAHNS